MDPVDAVTRRVDLRLIPLLTILYFISYLDRINIGNALVSGLANDTHATKELNWVVSIFYVSYVAFEIPSNLFMRRFGPSYWIGSLMLAWGTMLLLMTLVRNAKDLLISRFFLGAAEAGFFPSVIFYLTLWYRRKDQPLRMAIFFSGATLAGAFGGLLSYGIGQLAKNAILRDWQWIFLVEGIPTVGLGFVTFIFLVDYPRDVRWLNQCHKDILLNALREDERLFGDVEEKFSWKKVGNLLRDWKIPLYMLINFGALTPVFCLSTFLPLIIADMEFDNTLTQILTVPPYLIACLTSILVTWHSARVRERGLHLLVCLSVGMIGFLYLRFVSYHPYIGAILASIGVFSSYALIPSWLTCNIPGKLTRAIAVSLVAASGSVGGIFSGQIYRESDKPAYKLGHSLVLGIQLFTAALVILLKCLLIHENKNLLKKRESLKESQGLLSSESGRYGLDPRDLYVT